MKTAVNKNPLWQTLPGERKSYYSYFLGQNMIYSLVSAYLTTFLLLIGINPVKSAAVMLAVKVWDAVNDAIFGVIFDKITFKSGKKFIPWLKIACVLTPISTILLFIIPNTEATSEAFKLAWFAIAYIIWDRLIHQLIVLINFIFHFIVITFFQRFSQYDIVAIIF